MPGKNIIKPYIPQHYYHIYSRGVNKQLVFKGKEDYAVFLSLFKRYMGEAPSKAKNRHPYPDYHERLELLCYALMPNHIHLLIYQEDMYAIRDFMRSVMTSYSMYFNKKYARVGPVFQSRYRASVLYDDAYLQHITRYIHLNRQDWQASPYTSIDYYTGKRSCSWLRPQKILELFPDINAYIDFINDYESYKRMLDEVKWDLANQSDLS